MTEVPDRIWAWWFAPNERNEYLQGECPVSRVWKGYWHRNPSNNPLIIDTYERVTGKSRKGYRMSDVYRPTAEGTWAHPILAAVCPSPLWAQMINAIEKAKGTV